MKILSYALFRAPDRVHWRSDATADRISAYARFLPVMIRAHHAIWPGYELRIHHDDCARAHPYFAALERLQAQGLLRLVDCGAVEALTLAMLWRMRPVFEGDGERWVVTCDLDSLPLLRLRQFVEEFAASDKAAMLVHGCESHNIVGGGALGIRSTRFRQLIGASSWSGFVGLAGGEYGWSAYAADEEFLRYKIWERIADEAIVFSNNEERTIRCVDQRRAPALPPPDDLLPAVRASGDYFAPYIGSAGYELDAAFAFYDALPLPAMQVIRDCEGGVDVSRVMHP